MTLKISCLVDIVSLKLFCQFSKSKKKQFYVRNLYKTRKSTMNRSSSFGLIKEAIDLSRIRLAVYTLYFLAISNVLSLHGLSCLPIFTTWPIIRSRMNDLNTSINVCFYHDQPTFLLSSECLLSVPCQLCLNHFLKNALCS